jgi:hypothetical protein
MPEQSGEACNLIKAHPLKDSFASKMIGRFGIASLELKYCLVKNQPKYNPALYGGASSAWRFLLR